MTATEEERIAMLQQVKAKSFEKKGLLTAEEFKAIVERVPAEDAGLHVARHRRRSGFPAVST